MVGKEVISSSNIKIEKGKEEEEEPVFVKLFKFDCANIKKYIICSPPKNDDDKQLHMIGIVERHTYLEPFEHLSPDHAFIFYNNKTKSQFSQHSNNSDGTPTFAGYVFGEMKIFMNFLATGTQEDLGKWLDAEVAKNPLNSGSKV